MDPADSRRRLIATLRHAYSGERAAAYAYRGHWKSLFDPAQRGRIQQIEDEEWHHRRLVGDMLAALGAGPSGVLELRALALGRTLGVLCHLAGWFAPMYGAGRLESGNIGEYEDAAQHAAACGHAEFVDCLLTMAEVEWEHEHYFRGLVLTHRLASLVRVWPEPPPKDRIRRLGPAPLSLAAVSALREA